MRRTFRIGDFQPDPHRDFAEESRFHIDMMVEDLLAQGVSREEAGREAERRFGDMVRIREEATREESRRQRKMILADPFDTLLHDMSWAYAWRWERPGRG